MWLYVAPIIISIAISLLIWILSDCKKSTKLITSATCLMITAVLLISLYWRESQALEINNLLDANAQHNDYISTTNAPTVTPSPHVNENAFRNHDDNDTHDYSICEAVSAIIDLCQELEAYSFLEPDSEYNDCSTIPDDFTTIQLPYTNVSVFRNPADARGYAIYDVDNATINYSHTRPNIHLYRVELLILASDEYEIELLNILPRAVREIGHTAYPGFTLARNGFDRSIILFYASEGTYYLYASRRCEDNIWRWVAGGKLIVSYSGFFEIYLTSTFHFRQ